jgi:glycosyltransferase involved in cell wall biosynthesis|tara:strand:+ start:27122 stop:28159 length:1038 start_codon:yes stop_codon:yes gene_type:complete
MASLFKLMTMNKTFSFIIPIYNRPEEMKELLDSLCNQDTDVFEVVVVEDGSTNTSEKVVASFKDRLSISYFFKANSGPGASRNFGMKRAKGNYFIILDSDCVLPSGYLSAVESYLAHHKVDFFGGPDAADNSFSILQKAINFTMTSFLTTAGIRGSAKAMQKFEPRSFNMGISKEAFLSSGGFGRIHPGEDPDLSIRLWELGYVSSFIEKAFVFHKRRISWRLFFKQVHAFGSVRPILMKQYPKYAKPIFWLPTLFVLFILLGVILGLLGFKWPLILLGGYFGLLFVSALIKEVSFFVALSVVPAFFIQMFAYGWGFLKTKIRLLQSNKPFEEMFPNLYFKKGDE